MAEEKRATDQVPVLAAKSARGMSALLVIWVTAFCCLHALYLQRAMPDVPYMDSLRALVLLAGWEQGQVTLAQLWGLGRAHQGLINPSFIYANVELLHYKVMWANRLTTLAIALVALTIGREVLADYRDTTRAIIRGSWRWAWAIFLVLIPVQLFSGAGYELFTLDLGLSLWIKNVLIVLYYVLHSRFLNLAGTGRHGRWLGLALSLMGPVLILMVTMGWGGAFVLGATLQVLAGSGWRRRGPGHGRGMLKPVTLLWLSLLVYVAVSLLGREKGEFVRAGAAVATGDLLPMVAASLGSSVLPPGLASAWSLSPGWIQALGLALLILALCSIAVMAWRRICLRDTVPLALLAYAAATALAVAVGRAGDGLDGVMASRYYMDLILFPIGLVWLLLVLAGPGAGRGPAVAMVGALVLMLGLQVQVYRNEWRTAPYRAQLFQSMKQALLVGVPDPEAAALLQAPFKYARAASALMQKEGLGPFHGLGPPRCEAASVRFLRGWFAEEPQGRWIGPEAKLQVPGCPCQLKADLYIPAEFPERQLTVKSEGRDLQSLHLEPGKRAVLEVALSGSPQTLTLMTDKATQPAALGLGQDQRELAALVGPLSLACSAPSGGP